MDKYSKDDKLLYLVIGIGLAEIAVQVWSVLPWL
jgi:hypothetical protein